MTGLIGFPIQFVVGVPAGIGIILLRNGPTKLENINEQDYGLEPLLVDIGRGLIVVASAVFLYVQPFLFGSDPNATGLLNQFVFVTGGIGIGAGLSYLLLPAVLFWADTFFK